MDSCIDSLIDAIKDKPFDIIVRPHPEYVKRYGGKLSEFSAKYGDHKNIRLESDFSSSNSIFESDILITDWSTIAYDFAYSTKKPCVFINTPMKVMNPEYTKYTCDNLDIKLRIEVGVSVEIEQLGQLSEIIAELLLKTDDYRERITAIVEKYVYNHCKSAAVGGDYIIENIKSREKQ
jgi:YidC/Oxa1 family membrane protein insertase